MEENTLIQEIIDSDIHQAVLTIKTKNATPDALKKIKIHKFLLSKTPLWQAEEFKGTKVFHKNLNLTELVTYLESHLDLIWGQSSIICAEQSFILLVNNKGRLKVIRKQKNLASNRGTELNSDTQTVRQTPTNLKCACPTEKTHNREKTYILHEGSSVPFLHDLGIMTQDGTIVRAKYDKFRQINRFLEFIQDVLPSFSPDAGTGRDLVVIDFGCGKSYLTFAVYYYLHVIKGLKVQITGLDLKKEVIEQCNLLAHNYSYEKLKFEVGDIASFNGKGPIDLVISLHACDTATDFALLRAIEWNSQVILAVPCCQHEVNTQISKKGTELNQIRSSLEPLLRFGILKERFSSLLTDAIRAEILESAGYKVQILEFIDMNHTPKNLLIRAIKKNGDRAQKNEAQSALSECFGLNPSIVKEAQSWKKS